MTADSRPADEPERSPERGDGGSWFSVQRWWAMVGKEFLQLRRDRVTFAMIVGIPLIQLTLFGYAINTDPKHMPTAVITADHSEFTRSFVAALKTTDYFEIIADLPDDESGRGGPARGGGHRGVGV